MKIKKIFAAALSAVMVFGMMSNYSAYEKNKAFSFIVQAANSADNNLLNEQKSFLLDTEGETSSNVRNNNYNQSINSYLFETSDKCFNRVEYNKDHVIIEKISQAGTITSRKTITPELPKWGGFYAGANNYYMVWGQNNLEESNNAEVMRVVKYSKDWNRISSCSIYGANTYEQFRHGTLRIDEVNGQLIIHCSHTMYKIEDNLNHQANMTFVINESNMTVSSQFYNRGGISQGYASHSFNQFVKAEGNVLYRVDHGDADPTRGIAITKSNISTITNCSYNNIFRANGTSGYNATGISVGGFELSEHNGIVVGNSIDQNVSPWAASGQRNVFVSIVSKENLGAETKWITTYPKDSGITVRVPILIRIDNSKFVIMWEEVGLNKVISTKIATINENGAILTGVKNINVRLSDCQPIIASNGNITWYYTDNCSPIIYSLNPDDLSLSQDQTSLFEKEVKWDYNTDNATLTVSCDGKMPHYSAGGQPWNEYNSEIQRLIIQSGATSISNSAFYGMDKLKDVEIPSTVKSIGSSSFQNCFALERIKLPKSITLIGDMSFYRCTNLYSIDFDANIKKIGKYAFGYAYDFSNNPTIISNDIKIYGYKGSEAEKYANDNKIQFIDKSDYITELQYSFDETTGTLLISGQCPIRDYDNFKNKAPWADKKDKIKKIIIEEGITRIGKYSFNECPNLESISMPSTITSVGAYAFNSCKALSELQLSDSIKVIESHAFNFCIKIPSLTIPKSTVQIGEYAFANCIGLTNIEFEKGVVEIGDYAFYNCHSVKAIVLPDSLKTIGKRAFHLCNALDRVTIPISVESIGERAFGYVIDFNYDDIKATNYRIIGSEGSIAEAYAIENNLTFISIDQISTTTTITSTTIKTTSSSTTTTKTATLATQSSTSTTTPITSMSATQEITTTLPELSIGETNITLANGDQYTVTANRKDVTFKTNNSDVAIVSPKGVITAVGIGNATISVIDSESNAVQIKITVTSVATGATTTTTVSTTKLTTTSTTTTTTTTTSTTTATSTTSIYQGFYYKIIDTGIEITGIDDTVTGNVTIPEEINGMPVIRIGEYASWTREANPSGDIPNNDDGLSRILGSDYILVQKDIITTVSIPSSVKEIGLFAFSECKNLKQINFSSDLEKIEAGAFMETGITELKLPDSVKYIGASAFYGCGDLSMVTLPKNLEFLGMSNFVWSKLDNNISNGNFIVDGWYITYKALDSTYPKVLSIPEGTIGMAEQSYSYIYEKENDTTKIIIPSSLKTISDNSFRYYFGLEEFEVADNNPYLYAEKGVLFNKDKTKIIRFSPSSPIVNYTFPNTITSTSPWAFCYCQNLSSVTMDNELSELGGSAFKGCKNLSSVEFSNNISCLNSCVYINLGGAKGNVEIEGSFQECDSLEEITIPANIDYIGDSTLAFCENLKKVTVENPDCIIDDSGYGWTFGSEVLQGYKGSTLQDYAEAYNKRFIDINSPVSLGDVTNDGHINAVDASTVLAYYAMISTNKDGGFDDNQKAAADVDHDGKINAVDASNILSYYAYVSTTKEEVVPMEQFMKKAV